MFLGTYTPKLDDKGRLFLPAKFREELMAGLVVTTGQERCLTVYKLERILAGELDEVNDALVHDEQARRLSDG